MNARLKGLCWGIAAALVCLQVAGCDIGSILTGGGGRNEDSEVDRMVYVYGEEIHSSWLRTSRLKILRKKGTYGSPTWSPDGNRIAFLDINAQARNDTLVIMDKEGRILGEPYVGDVADNLLKWLPDGNRLLFLARIGGGFTPGLYPVMLELESGVLDTLTQLDPFVANHTWSPSGDRLYYSTPVEGSWSIGYTQIPSGITDVLESDPDRRHLLPSVSPDGSQVAYISVASRDPEIWVHDLITGNLARVVTAPVVQKSIVWSADGRRLAFTKDAQVFLVNTDGSGLEQITQVPANYKVMDWSPKGTEVVFSANIEPIKVSLIGAETYILNLNSDELIMAVDFGLDVDILWKD